jgi:hypothetical protein
LLKNMIGDTPSAMVATPAGKEARESWKVLAQLQQDIRSERPRRVSRYPSVNSRSAAAGLSKEQADKQARMSALQGRAAGETLEGCLRVLVQTGTWHSLGKRFEEVPRPREADSLQRFDGTSAPQPFGAFQLLEQTLRPPANFR